MHKTILILGLIAFVACKKSKTEAPPPEPPGPQQYHPLSIDGFWRIVIDNKYGPNAIAFYTRDSIYERRSALTPGMKEQGQFHTRSYGNPDSLEVHLLHDTLIIERLDNSRIELTAGDSTRVYRRYTMPG
ncbi:hypothetical protein [Chitinophaga niabensis]|uniref:Lipocalin-like domain-containing protein n=1 Tax=Chitinophaga niabensis TaxID=536979 RepID=A0A1N6EQJ5_9BACT|nr:hypothetical protein [Chitinophaga niabensis]SIN85274.1 hypothetical protein SAMN04488055_1763 [Chitinophaga niabensis]